MAISAMYSAMAQMHQVVGLDKDKESPGRRCLDLGKFAPEVLDKHFA